MTCEIKLTEIVILVDITITDDNIWILTLLNIYPHGYKFLKYILNKIAIADAGHRFPQVRWAK